MSSNGEDIIRETFEKLGDAIGVQMQMPDAMITNLGAVLQAQIDLLAELQSTGRLIPAGGMALTAEQVEDVRTVVNNSPMEIYDAKERGLYYAAAARLRALFPATEPAEEGVGDPLQAWKGFLKPKPIGWYRTMTPQFATEHFGFPGVIGSKGFWTHTASDGGKWAWDGDDWELREYPPAPAEPAEEETKAEGPCEVRSPQGGTCSFPKPGHAGVHTWAWPDKKPASSPVVPAPTETGPKTWCAITGADSNPGGEHAYVTVRVPKDFISGQSMADLAGAGKSRELARLLTPFVAAEEG